MIDSCGYDGVNDLTYRSLKGMTFDHVKGEAPSSIGDRLANLAFTKSEGAVPSTDLNPERIVVSLFGESKARNLLPKWHRLFFSR